MSLVRNFTRRARAHTRGEEVATVPRSCTVRYTPGTINRAKISLPTELLSTTNVDALNAPDIKRAFTLPTTPTSSSGSIHSDSDFGSSEKGFLGTHNSSNSELAPLTPITPFSDFGISNDGKDFFSSKPATSSSGVPTLAAAPTPAIPTRAPSHSKKAHVELSQQRLATRSLSPPPTDIGETSAPVVSSLPLAKNIVDNSDHPFSRELAKVDELAEGFGAGMILDEEEQEMVTKGLRKFTVDDYVAELTGMTGGVFEDKIILNPWI